MAWYAHGGGNGRPLGAMRIAMKSPQTPDCRGGVFAVFAKIPPPIPSPAAHPIEASIPRGDLTHGHVGSAAFVKTIGPIGTRREGQKTTRHAASLRPPKNGENRF